MKKWPLAVALSLAGAPRLARANDSTAVLAAGGLVLTKSQDISMESEDLQISDALIRVFVRKDFVPTQDLKLVYFTRTPPP